MNRRLLITTPLPQTWETNRPFTLLGKWCLPDGKLSEVEKKYCEIEPYHWDDRELLSNDYIRLNAFYEEVLVDLTEAMNRIHGVVHGVRYWRILMGVWLGYIVEILYDRWLSIKNAAASQGKYETTVVTCNADDFIPNDMISFSRILMDDNWNHFVYSTVIREFSSISVFEKEIGMSFQRATDQSSKLTRIDVKNRILMWTEKILSPLVRRDDCFFIATYLPYWKQIKLKVALGEFPMVYCAKEILVEYEPKKEFRGWSLESATNKPASSSLFENWARKFIPSQIPAVYLEGYKNQLARTKNVHWPKSPKVIWTSNAYNFHDFFKLWAAEKVEQGSKLIIGQHGGNYGMAKWNFSEDHQVSISDVYFSWGWMDVAQPKIVPVGQLKSLSVVSDGKADSQRAMLVTMELPRYSYMMMSAVVAGQWLDYLEDQYEFINLLPPGIRENFVVRLKLRENGWRSFERWQRQFPDLKIDVGKSNFHNEIKKCQLVVSTYNAATYLESMAMNIPTVIFWNPEHWELRGDATEYMKDLEKAGIFHSSPVSAAGYIEQIWPDVSGWWKSDSVQEAKNRFCQKYSYLPGNMNMRIKAIINKLS